MMAGAYFDAYHETDHEVGVLAGLASALSDIARESKAILHADPESRQIMALITVIEEKAKGLGPLHSAEWDAAKQG